jgi:hypothetical protein
VATASPSRRLTEQPPSATGIGVDYQGAPVIDPTKNVLDLVDAESRFNAAARAADNRFHDAMRDAETRRVNDLEAQKVRYETQAAAVLTVQVKTTSELISTQLDKVTTALGAQITTLSTSFGAQISALSTSLLDRIGELERFRWEVGGKTSVQDPALASALAAMADAIKSLQSQDQMGRGRSIGRGEILAYIVAASTIVGVVGALVFRH